MLIYLTLIFAADMEIIVDILKQSLDRGHVHQPVSLSQQSVCPGALTEGGAHAW